MEIKTNRETTHALGPLLRQAINHNSEALDELFSRYRDRLYNAALRVLGNSDDAEDALQDGAPVCFSQPEWVQGSFPILDLAHEHHRQRRPDAIAPNALRGNDLLDPSEAPSRR